MMTCRRSQLEARCRERGYSLEEVMPCVVAMNGDKWTIDTKHLAYPRPRGPGTELKAILASLGLAASGDCKCESRVALMDARGCDWCAANEGQIVGWLRESAGERGLPFLDSAGRLLVRRAIANARRKAPQ